MIADGLTRRGEGERWMQAALAAYDALTTVIVTGILVPVECALRWLGRAGDDDLAERLGQLPRAASPAGASAPRAAAAGDGHVVNLDGVTGPRSGTTCVLVHAVSVGEMRAAAVLVEALAAEAAAEGRTLELVLTAGNRDGRAAAKRLAVACPAIRQVQLMPWDRRRALRGWLATVRPDVVVVVETEIWPRFFLTCREMGIPLVVVSARLRPRDVGRYRLARPFFRHVLAAAEWIGVQGALDRQRYLCIGAPPERLRLMGDLKLGVGRPDAGGHAAAAGVATLDAPADAGTASVPADAGKNDALADARAADALAHARSAQAMADGGTARAPADARAADVVTDAGVAPIGRDWQLVLAASAPLLIAGSTHAPEERWLLQALAAWRASGRERSRRGATDAAVAASAEQVPARISAAAAQPRLVLAPRRPARAAAVCRLAERLGFRVRRFSAGPADGWDVLVVDSLGVLADLYGPCGGGLAFVGGTLAPHAGGHTPIEAAAAGLGLLAGPRDTHVAELTAGLERVGALARLSSRQHLAPVWAALAGDPRRRAAMGRAARAFVAAHGEVGADYARAVLATARDGSAKQAATSLRR